MATPSIDGERLLARLEELGAVGRQEDGSCCRLALTDEDRRGRDLVVSWMRELGLEVRVDRVQAELVLVLPARALLLRGVAVLALPVLVDPLALPVLPEPLVPALLERAFPPALAGEAWTLKCATRWSAASAVSTLTPSTPTRPPILLPARAKAGSSCR